MNGIQGLYSAKREEVFDAIEAARERGTLEWVRPLLETFRDTSDEEIRQEIGGMLGSLKISDAAAVLSDALEDPEFDAVRADIIGFLWSCGFQSEDDLRAVIRGAVEGDYRCAMEALTWVEELEAVRDEHALLDAILLVRGVLESDDAEAASGEDRIPLFQAILAGLQNLERAQ